MSTPLDWYAEAARLAALRESWEAERVAARCTHGVYVWTRRDTGWECACGLCGTVIPWGVL